LPASTALPRVLAFHVRLLGHLVGKVELRLLTVDYAVEVPGLPRRGDMPFSSVLVSLVE